MMWKPETLDGIVAMIETAQPSMRESERRLWKRAAIPPEKWTLTPWGDEGGGFWAVAIVGRWVMWYNDIEDGFNISPYATYGEIGEYWCNQEELEVAVRNLVCLITSDA